MSKLKGGHAQAAAMNGIEMRKPYPTRYPSNGDSIGIEIVGRWLGDANHPDIKDYEKLTPQEQESLKWLVSNLIDALRLERTDMYRHPEVSRKKSGEALDAAW